MKPVDAAEINRLLGERNSMKSGSAPFDYSLDFKVIDFRQHPERYRIGKGEAVHQGDRPPVDHAP